MLTTESPWALLRKSFHEHPGKRALIIGDVSLTYGELDARSADYARWLSRRTTVGDRIALLVGNTLPYLLADVAIHRLGLVKVPLNPLLSARDVAHILRDSGAQLVLVAHSVTGSIAGLDDALSAISGVEVVDAESDEFERELSDDHGIDERDLPGDAPAAILYTGGTTGKPKGVVHTRTSVALNLISHILEGEVRNADVLLLASALSHSAGLFAAAALARGATVVVQHKFVAVDYLATINREHVTWLSLVPTMLYRLMDHLKETGATAPSIATIVYGSAPITVGRLQEAIGVFGPIFIQLYGQTEVPNFGTTLTKADHAQAIRDPAVLRSCGRSSVMAEVAILDPGGAAVPNFRSGEICLRAPYTMSGYYQKPDATATTLIDGWVHTRDIGYLDNKGYLYIQDRVSDMIISGGYNVYCSEVETQVQKIDGVGQVTVIGLPDEDWGEVVCAVIVKAAHRQDVTEEYVLHEVLALLGSYKRPKQVRFVDSIPVTPFGKADKKALRAVYARSSVREPE